MKKQFKNYLVLWATLLVLFNVIAFVSVGWIGVEKYTASFWIGYVFITVSFIGQLICSKIVFDTDTARKTFYNLPYITTSYSGLIASFLVGGLCMLNSVLPYWIGIIICSVILAINVIDILKVRVVGTEVERVDEKIQSQTFFIKSLTADADVLMSKAKSDVVKQECKKVYEAFRYSDKMSNEKLNDIENEISVSFSKFSDAVKADDAEKSKELSAVVVSLVEERNKKCKLLK